MADFSFTFASGGTQNKFASTYTAELADFVTGHASSFIAANINADFASAFAAGEYTIQIAQNDSEGFPFLRFDDGLGGFYVYSLDVFFDPANRVEVTVKAGRSDQTRYYFSAGAVPDGNVAPVITSLEFNPEGATFLAFDAADQTLSYEAPFDDGKFGSVFSNSPCIPDPTLPCAVGSSVFNAVAGDAVVEGVLSVTDDGTPPLSTAVAWIGLGTDPVAEEVDGENVLVGGNDVIDASADPNAAGLRAGIWGFGGNDTLTGGAGDDYIVGGTGADVMTGDLGADVFVQNTGDSIAATRGWNNTSGGMGAMRLDADATVTFGDGVDVITDFVSAQDLLDSDVVGATNASGSDTATLGAGNYYIVGRFDANVFTVDAVNGADVLFYQSVGSNQNGADSIGTTSIVLQGGAANFNPLTNII